MNFLSKFSLNSTASEDKVSSYSILDFHPSSGWRRSSAIPSIETGTLKLKCLKLVVSTLSSLPLFMASRIFSESCKLILYPYPYFP